MKSRKTIEVGTLLAWANYRLEKSADAAKEEREEIAHFIELVLHETGNYEGYAVSEGDDTRRRYHPSAKVSAEYRAKVA